MAAALILLVSVAAATNAASAKDSADLDDLQACSASMKAGTCRCPVRLLHPTQMSVGMAQVEAKVEQLKKKAEKGKLFSYLAKHREPVTIGPEGVLYITDHHHLARALLDMGVDDTYCQIEDNRSDQALDVFWTGMVADGKAWPEDEKGEEHAPTAIPCCIEELRDDPYRSLAGEVRNACGFEKTSENFAEFKWADFFRRTEQPGTGQPIPAQLIQTNMDEAIEQAMELAKSTAAKNLPGYLPIPCKVGD